MVFRFVQQCVVAERNELSNPFSAPALPNHPAAPICDGAAAVVLHGNELRLFQKGQDSLNQSLVDRARMLDQDNIIDIKACQTMMRTLQIDQEELPSFIEQVQLILEHQ